MLGVLGIIASLIAALLIGGQRSAPSTDPAAERVSGDGSVFSVIIDAGSTGSRLHVFRFNASEGRLLDVGGEAQVWKSVKPGLSSFVADLGGLEAHFAPLLAAALDVVPPTQRASTVLALRATAGLRMLPEGQADALMMEARRVLVPYGFRDGSVHIMDGDEEGELLWVSLNFLMGTLQSPVGDASVAPVAVVDLGGGSVQMTYTVAPSYAGDSARAEYVKKLALPFGLESKHVYTYSYLGYGLMAARATALKEAAALGIPEGEHPCIPTGFRMHYDYGGSRFEGVGASDAVACQKFLSRTLHRERPCGDGEAASTDCSFAGAWAGPGSGQQHLVLASYFFDRLQDAGLLEDGAVQREVTLSDYIEAANRACEASRAGSAMSAAYPELKREWALWMCFDLSYITVLLIDGFGVKMEQRLLAVSEIKFEGRNYQSSWALGAALKMLHM